MDRGEARRATNVVERDREVALREAYDAADPASADPVRDEDSLPFAQAADPRVMRGLSPESDRRPGLERLVTAEESG
jgi:hypothetical protein